MSKIEITVQQYLKMRRSLGFKLLNEGFLLPQFVDFLQQRGSDFITVDLSLEWAMQPQKCLPAHWGRRLSIIRIFASYCSTIDPRTEIPSQYLLPHRYHRKTPYIYSDQEVLHLLEAAVDLSSPVGLRAATYETLFGLLSATGMRIGETISLDIQDVDLTKGILTVRHSKFGKSRLLPIHKSVQYKLKAYESLRDRVIAVPKARSFFISEAGHRLTYGIVRHTFIKLSHQIGLRNSLEKHGPRLHDFRHTFTVKTLLRWYQSSVNVEQRMPYLSTYLGHRHVKDTYWYLTAVPELLKLVTDRLDIFKGGLP